MRLLIADTYACTLTYDLDVFVVIQQQILHLQISVSTIADIGNVRLESDGVRQEAWRLKPADG